MYGRAVGSGAAGGTVIQISRRGTCCSCHLACHLRFGILPLVRHLPRTSCLRRLAVPPSAGAAASTPKAWLPRGCFAPAQCGMDSQHPVRPAVAQLDRDHCAPACVALGLRITQENRTTSTVDAIVTDDSLGLALGRVCVATGANIAAWTVAMGRSGFGINGTLWAMGAITAMLLPAGCWPFPATVASLQPHRSLGDSPGWPRHTSPVICSPFRWLWQP